MCAIGRGLMSRPRLLVIDELSLGLAPLVVDHLLDLISQINGKGTTVLLVEQDVQVALEHAHRGYVLETGRIVQTGPGATSSSTTRASARRTWACDGRAAPPRDRGSDLALPALFFATVAVFADLYVTQPILPLLSHEFGVPAPTAALTVSVVVLMIALVSNAYGPSRGRVADASPSWSASCAAARRPDAPLRGAPRRFPPSSSSAPSRASSCRASPPSPSPRSATPTPARPSGPAVGSYVAASVLGGLTGRVASGWIASHFSWRGPFLVFGAVTLLGALGMALHLPASPRGAPAARSGARSGRWART